MVFDRLILKSLLGWRNRHHLLSGHPRLVCFAFDPITAKIHLDGRFEAAELSALAHDVFPHLSRDGICLDIGANIGNHAVAFAPHFARVHAFEPNPKVFRVLQINADLCPGITVWNLGCSDHAADIEVVENLMNLGGTGIGAGVRAAGDRVIFHVVALDQHDFLKAGDKVAFIKIDVEGHELQVIRGARRLLARDLPALTIEVHRGKVANGTCETIEELRGLGYRHLYEVTRRRGFAHLVPGWRPTLVPLLRLAARSYPMLLVTAAPLV